MTYTLSWLETLRDGNPFYFLVLIGGFHLTSSPSCWWTVNKRSLIYSSLCLSTSICSFHHCYLCLPRLHENHLFIISRWAFGSELSAVIARVLNKNAVSWQTRNNRQLPKHKLSQNAKNLQCLLKFGLIEDSVTVFQWPWKSESG